MFPNPEPMPWLTHVPGSPEELAAFQRLQDSIVPMFQEIFPNPQLPRTVVTIPSLSLNAEELAKITGVHHYEERLLCLLLLLQMPRTHVIYLTSQPIQPSIINYYLHLLPGVPSHHARNRLTLLSCHDASPKPLTQKILERPRLLAKLKKMTLNEPNVHVACFNTTPLERTLCVELQAPLFGSDPALCHLGDKSHGRELFRNAGIDIADGFEHLRDEKDIVGALADLRKRNPNLRKAVVKLNEGFSGEGNATFKYDGAPKEGLEAWIQDQIPTRLNFEAPVETWDRYKKKFEDMQGIVEAWLEGDIKCSPSVQCRIEPHDLQKPVVVSTHDQLLGGPSGQVFLGCTFPAHEDYRLDVQNAGERIGDQLKQRGVIGRFAADFISVKEEDRWKHYAIEINLRKGGTTLPFLMLEFLTNGQYDAQTGLYHIPTGQPRFYYASDNLQNDRYQGLAPDDLMDILVYNELYFNSAKQEGVVFHLMGALSEFGKLGLVCIGDNYETATQLYKDAVAALDREATSYDKTDSPLDPLPEK